MSITRPCGRGDFVGWRYNWINYLIFWSCQKFNIPWDRSKPFTSSARSPIPTIRFGQRSERKYLYWTRDDRSYLSAQRAFFFRFSQLKSINDSHRCCGASTHVAEYMTTCQRNWIKHCILLQQGKKIKYNELKTQFTFIIMRQVYDIIRIYMLDIQVLNYFAPKVSSSDIIVNNETIHIENVLASLKEVSFTQRFY